jgi:choline/ethanolamine kinase
LYSAVFFVTAQNPYRRVLLRVYGIGCDQLVDREQELAWLSILSRLGIGALLLGTFANGRVEQYLDCHTLTRDDIRVPKTSCQIARGLYELHAIVQSYPNQPNILPELWRNIFNWIPIVQSILPNLEKRSEHHRSIIKCFDLPQAFADIPLFKQCLDDLHSPIVFAHNDVSKKCSHAKYDKSWFANHAILLLRLNMETLCAYEMVLNVLW